MLQDLDFGTYAIAVIHDENSSKELETGIFGIPKEGVGFSNNPKIIFGPPSFKDASFALCSQQFYLKVGIKYF